MKAERKRVFTPSQTVKIWIGTGVGWLLTWVLGGSLRFSVVGGREHFESLRAEGRGIVFTFWHNQIIPAAVYFRFQNIAVITSQHLDGEYIGRIVKSFGYLPVRGSSSRGGARALMEALKIVRKGGDVAFTIDGPRGPRYQVKPGPVLLARKTGVPILPFHIEVERFWELGSWDRFRIPKPFSRAAIRFGPPLEFVEDVSEEKALACLQESMDRLRSAGEVDFSRAFVPDGG